MESTSDAVLAAPPPPEDAVVYLVRDSGTSKPLGCELDAAKAIERARACGRKCFVARFATGDEPRKMYDVSETGVVTACGQPT
jgi:hypothetical protein